jgi:hypothetical protein
VNSDGNVFIDDGGNSRVLGYDNPLSGSKAADVVLLQSNFTSYYGMPPLGGGGPQGSLAFDSSGNLYFAQGTVLEFNAPFSNGQASPLLISQNNQPVSPNAHSARASGVGLGFQ